MTTPLPSYDACIRLLAAVFEQTVEDLSGVHGAGHKRDALEWVMSPELEGWVWILAEVYGKEPEDVRAALLSLANITPEEADEYRWEPDHAA